MAGKPGQFVYLQILQGHAFIDYIINESETPPTSYFIFHVYCGNQRFISSPVVSSCDPEIQEGFLLKISEKPNYPHSLQDLLALAQPIHIVMTVSSPRGEVTLLGTCKIDWRTALCCHNNIMTHSVELVGLKTEGQIPAGVLSLRWELISKQKNCLNKDVLEAQTQLEQQRETETKRMFLLYAKQWWREYLAIRPNHSQRTVKIFAEDETNNSKMVCRFINPLRAGRLLDGPRHSARFVSLLEYRHSDCIGETNRRKEGTGEIWMRLHSVLATKSGVCNIQLKTYVYNM